MIGSSDSQKYIYPTTHIESIYLPSTSSANATMKLEDLVEEYQKNIDLFE